MAATLRQRVLNEFGNLPKDANRSPIQVGNYFLTQDGTGTPQPSPLSYSSTTITIVVPKGAVQMVCFPTTDMRISELSANPIAQYDIVPAGTKEVIPCAEMANIYIMRDAVDGSLRFKFIFI